MIQNDRFKNLTNAIIFINFLKKDNNYQSMILKMKKFADDESIFLNEFKDDKDLKDAIDYIGNTLNNILLNFLYQLPDVKDIRKILEEKRKNNLDDNV